MRFIHLLLNVLKRMVLRMPLLLVLLYLITSVKVNISNILTNGYGGRIEKRKNTHVETTFILFEGGKIMTSIEFIARELLTTPKELKSRCKRAELVRKRWTVMCFYKLLGFNTSKIGAYLGVDHNTVQNGLERADKSIKDKAKECYKKFAEVEPDNKLLPRRVKIVKIPDYKHNIIITKEIEI